MAETIYKLQPPKDDYFYEDNFYLKLKPILEKNQKKISEGLSYNRYFKIYEDTKRNATLTIWLKRVSL